MSGIMFPDFLGTLGKAAAFENASAQRDWLDEDRKAKAEVAPLIPKALQGDKEALGQIGTRHPDTAMKLAPLLERLDASQRAKAKESAEFITSNGMAILSAPPEQQPQIYARVRQEAQASGRDVSSWPTTYDPGWVKFNVDKAMPFAEHFKRSGEGVTFAPPSGGGGGPAPAGGGIDRSAGAISGIESGGRYDAVGPAANEKGQRAYGKYQVMDFNVGPWTQEILGQAMTPQQFLASPQAQDAVFKAKFGQYIQKHGSPEAASRAWFAGEGGMNKPGAKDVLGTSVADYGSKFAQAYGQGATGPQIAQGSDMPAADGSGTPLPPAQQALAPLKGLQIPPGARVALQGGVPIVKDGNVLYLDANGGWGAAPLPSRAAPAQRQLPSGYEENPEGGGLRPIAGGPADKKTGGPFAGNGMDAQAMNVVLTGDPASPEYALAYSHLSKPRTTLDEQGRPVTIQPMDLSAVRKPAGVAAAPAAVGGGTTTALPGGGSVTVGESVAPKGPSAKELADIKTARTEAETIITALEDFRKEFKGADTLTRGKSALGMTTGLNTSYNVAALLAKGEALFNLGVLNGPDLDIIRRTLPDPSTMKGAGTGAGDMSAAVDKVISILNTRLQSKEQQLGVTAEPKKAPAQGADRGKILFDARDAIAKGAPRDKVIERLKAAGITEEP